MKILIYSTAFYPMIGGLENVAEALATEFAALGHEVRVACEADDPGHRIFPFHVVRRPSALRLVGLVRWSDAVLHMNVSLKALFPFLPAPRPWIVSHQGLYWNEIHPMTWRARLKYFFSRFATNIACSTAVAAPFKTRCVVVPNPYDEATFKLMPEVARTRDLVFAGRLVSDKGAAMLVEALAKIRAGGLQPTLTITGSGPEEQALKKQVRERELDSQVRFTGPLRGAELAAMMNSHRIMVVPSIWNEPFGIVALEGIACGCVVIGSSGGGLPEAIGPCGLTFPNRDGEALAASISALLHDPARIEKLRSQAQEHLLAHRKTAVAKRYLEVIRTSLGR